MNEYIKRDELVSWMKKAGKFLKVEQDHKRVCHVIGKIIDHIEAMPAADMVEVVRCKDCKFSQFIPHNGKYSCCKFMIPRLEQDFCSSGERKEGLKNG